MTPHFTLAEFVRSDTAAARHIDNTLPRELVANALATLQMLERIRAWLCQAAGHEVPITITSGYRSPALNQAIGSLGRSDHPRAMAADWVAPTLGTPTELAAMLAPQVGVLGIGQLILEYPDRGGTRAWVHTSTAMPMRPVNRIITITDAGVLPGIVGA